jgi:hypothetical protein
MPPRLSLILLCALALGVSCARARVGETQPQIEARYGGPGKEIGDQVLYASGDMNVSVFYTASVPVQVPSAPADGKAAPKTVQVQVPKATMEIYSHRTGPDGSKPELTQADIDGLLRDEGGGQDWAKIDKDGITTWYCPTRLLFARFEQDDQALVFISREHRAAMGKPSVLLQDGKAAPTP